MIKRSDNEFFQDLVCWTIFSTDTQDPFLLVTVRADRKKKKIVKSAYEIILALDLIVLVLAVFFNYRFVHKCLIIVTFGPVQDDWGSVKDPALINGRPKPT